MKNFEVVFLGVNRQREYYYIKARSIKQAENIIVVKQWYEYVRRGIFNLHPDIYELKNDKNYLRGRIVSIKERNKNFR